jgi:tricorn protease
MKRIALSIALWFSAANIAAATTDKPVLLQSPTVSQTEIVFATAGDLWIVSRSGGEAKRLTETAEPCGYMRFVSLWYLCF